MRLRNIRLWMLIACAVAMSWQVKAKDGAEPETLADLNQLYQENFITLEDKRDHSQGEYLARAADCMGCHGEDLAGGITMPTPMGNIVSTNITPSKTHGIGEYDLEDFTKAVRDGVTPTHRLYPAMPYVAYHDMRDEDVSKIFHFLQTVEPIDEDPEQETELTFPFNVRSLMAGYNLLHLSEAKEVEELDAQAKRGEYLVNTLGHCADCHTPRDSTMGYQDDKHLAGNNMGHFYAPNITPDKKTGIGAWSEDDIVTFLKYGVLEHRAYAGGEMGKAYAHSLLFFTDEDLHAMAAYLKTIPAVENKSGRAPLNIDALPPKESDSITFNLLEQIEILKQEKAQVINAVGTDTVAGDVTGTDSASSRGLYLTYCASCHGANGYGQPEANYPALAGLSIIRSHNTEPLIKIIARGQASRTNTTPKMPGFANRLSHEQIAGLVNYLRMDFGTLTESHVDAKLVQKAINSEPPAPFLIKHAQLLMFIGLLIAIALLVLLIRYLRRRKHHRAEQQAHGHTDTYVVDLDDEQVIK